MADKTQKHIRYKAATISTVTKAEMLRRCANCILILYFVFVNTNTLLAGAALHNQRFEDRGAPTSDRHSRVNDIDITNVRVLEEFSREYTSRKGRSSLEAHRNNIIKKI